MSQESNKPSHDSGQSQGKKAGDSGGLIRRRSPWAGTYESIKYISGLSRSKFRSSDKITEVLAAVSLLGLGLLIFMPSTFLRLPLALFCDTIFSICVIFFITNRLGIMTSLSERQAILVWDVILVSLLLGALIAVNVMMVASHLRQMPGMY